MEESSWPEFEWNAAWIYQVNPLSGHHSLLWHFSKLVFHCNPLQHGTGEFLATAVGQTWDNRGAVGRLRTKRQIWRSNQPSSNVRFHSQQLHMPPLLRDRRQSGYHSFDWLLSVERVVSAFVAPPPAYWCVRAVMNPRSNLENLLCFEIQKKAVSDHGRVYCWNHATSESSSFVPSAAIAVAKAPRWV